MLNSLELTGRANTHVTGVPELAATLHNEAAQAALALREAARVDGLELEVVSSFRDFARQEAIWNRKYQGERPLLDREEREVDIAKLDERGIVDTILLWSALPGASRHHWGSDMDVVDRSAVAADYRPRLTASEFTGEGPFARLNGWLSANMRRFGFFRPYTKDRGGVQPEPWHLSYAPVAVPALHALTPEVLMEAIATSSMYGREHVLARLPELHSRFVRAVSSPRTGTRPS
jgi:LAS superfamily LD-carboxypeptidase LdcB